ncbi:MAG: hypothetical protein QM634_09165, partial [Gordonia sp. (in: high G+C Gram-positive bacteria)]
MAAFGLLLAGLFTGQVALAIACVVASAVGLVLLLLDIRRASKANPVADAPTTGAFLGEDVDAFVAQRKERRETGAFAAVAGTGALSRVGGTGSLPPISAPEPTGWQPHGTAAAYGEQEPAGYGDPYGEPAGYGDSYGEPAYRATDYADPGYPAPAPDPAYPDPAPYGGVDQQSYPTGTGAGWSAGQPADAPGFGATPGFRDAEPDFTGPTPIYAPDPTRPVPDYADPGPQGYADATAAPYGAPEPQRTPAPPAEPAAGEP